LGQAASSPKIKTMGTVQEIENAIQLLPERDVLTFTQGLDDHAEHKWSTRIEADVVVRTLAALADKARDARTNGTLCRCS
jgi:hypothetical protein